MIVPTKETRKDTGALPDAYIPLGSDTVPHSDYLEK